MIKDINYFCNVIIRKGKAYLVLPSINLITINGVNNINAAKLHPIHWEPELTESCICSLIYGWSLVRGSPIINNSNIIQVNSNASAIIRFMPKNFNNKDNTIQIT